MTEQKTITVTEPIIKQSSMTFKNITEANYFLANADNILSVKADFTLYNSWGYFSNKSHVGKVTIHFYYVIGAKSKLHFQLFAINDLSLLVSGKNLESFCQEFKEKYPAYDLITVHQKSWSRGDSLSVMSGFGLNYAQNNLFYGVFSIKNCK